MQYLKLLPDINMRFLSTNTKLGESGELPQGVQPDEDFEESKKKRIEILKRFLNRKIMQDPSAYSTQYLDASISMIQGSSSKKLRFKKKKALPEYLKEDFPDRGIHEARIEARKLNEKKASSPTAMQYSQMLDYDIAFKGIPEYMKTWVKKGKKKSRKKLEI